ncbi:DNA polymerase [Gallid alphaherpesvirus 3]|uniref:DNA polymerase n=2 Tax=Gallid alphaherpesvirus 3 TaxID=35250 RepID=Q9WSY3_9ALPH|nr:DNA polymerase catalytic subunit [Gallid alphaherpesvirus 3]BAA78719.1 UL30 protein [Marek's disease virus serotype 2 MDV2]BAA82926.1 UL30 product homolog [Marek's disease virus serotype 2 MDV2]BAB16540.1 DNA polymerase [Gallid alphaherpesvirus 3]
MSVDGARTFFNPYLGARKRGRDEDSTIPPLSRPRDGERYLRQHRNAITYIATIDEFKYIAPKCLDAAEIKQRGTHIGKLKRSPILYKNGEEREFLNFEALGDAWPRRCFSWNNVSFLPTEFDPRFSRFHVYDMIETVEFANGATGRDKNRFLELLRPMGTIITMMGMTECGRRVAVHVYGVKPYFYMRKIDVDTACGSRSTRGLAEQMASVVRSSVNESARKRFYGSSTVTADCFEVDVVRRKDIYFYGTDCEEYYRIRCQSGKFVALICDNFHPSIIKYEGSVDTITRMVLDNAGFSTFGWYSLKIGNCGEKVQVRAPQHHVTSCDIEINCTVDNLIGHPEDDHWPDYKLLCFDIECKSGGANECAFPVATNEEDVVIQISCLMYSVRQKQLEHALLFALGSCDLPETFQETFRDTYGVLPEVLEFVTGYNIVNFDWAFIVNKLTTVYGIRLDGYGVINQRGTFKVWDAGANAFQKKGKFKATGIIALDMYCIATEKLKLQSYKLDVVAEAALGERKKELSYKEIPTHFAAGPSQRGIIGEYCFQDSLLVGKLFFKYVPHLELSAIAKLAGILLSRAVFDGQQIRVYTCLLRLAGSRNFILPNKPQVRAGTEFENSIASTDEFEGEPSPSNPKASSSFHGNGGRVVGYQGAKVLDPISGFHVDPVVVFDFASLYPSIIQAHNLCFTTLINDDRKLADLRPRDDYMEIDVQGKSLHFAKPHIRESLLGILLKDWLAMRKAIRAKIPASSDDTAVLLDKQQAAIKVVCNSVYGFCGVANGLLPCIDVAATVTTIGRDMLLTVRDYVKVKWGTRDALLREFPALTNYMLGDDYSVSVIYGDTDSVFIKFKGVAIQGLVANGDDMAKRISSDLFPKPIKLECEKTFDKLLLITKKKYMGTIHGGRMLMKGVDIVRKNNCRFINTYAKKLSDLLFQDDAVAKAAALVAERPSSFWATAPLPEGLKPFGDILAEAYGQMTASTLSDVGDFVMSAELSRPPQAYANKRIAHLTVYHKLAMRSEQLPMVKDRISYVIAAATPEVLRDAERVAEARGERKFRFSEVSVPEVPGTFSNSAKTRAVQKPKVLISDMAEDPTYLIENNIPLNTDYYLSHLLGTLCVIFKALFGNDTKTTDTVLKRFIPETYTEDRAYATRVARAVFAEIRSGAGLSSSEEEETLQRLNRAFRILTEVRRRY